MHGDGGDAVIRPPLGDAAGEEDVHQLARAVRGELPRPTVRVVEVVEHDLAHEVGGAGGVDDEGGATCCKAFTKEVGEQERSQVVDLEVRLVTVGGQVPRGEGSSGVVHQ